MQKGGYLAKRCVDILQVKPKDIESYGKGAIVGVDGEIVRAAAILHPRFGAPVVLSVLVRILYLPQKK